MLSMQRQISKLETQITTTTTTSSSSRVDHLNLSQAIAESLKDENIKLKGEKSRLEEQLERNSSSVICLTKKQVCTLVACGHANYCEECIDQPPAPQICPLCRTALNPFMYIFYK